ncbi:ABC transporter substrate-binding protein [Hylemonella gracilis]|uniref:ABC transporter substrate-binding protein n=1 Tax=Hylemonella gracilis TaxID=80880 RepID=A0A4P6UKU5_9BURK|nr:ABC transporter substrate-binding protein [Hylemonella gracilis]QBK05822.1 ABC transporter substrate-binding protein [Hylemonella gracilis]
MQRKTFNRFLMTSAMALGLGHLALAQTVTEVPFFYPVAVGGPITKVVDGLAEEFNKAHPGIQIKPVYAGTYQETIVKALTGHKSGQPPVAAVLLSTDLFTLIDEDAIQPLDGYVKTAADKAWLSSFYPGFLLNSRTGGKTWGAPFQRSTIVMYYNKDLLKAAGIAKAPETWAELAEAAKKLTKKDSAGKTVQYGMQIPSTGYGYWMLQALATQNGAVLANDAGNAVKLDDPKVIEALEYWVKLAKDGVHPQGVVEWGTTPKDFLEQKTAIMWTTTGNLTNVRKNASFDFGVAMLPAQQRRGSPTGGGNFYIFKKATPAQQQAAFQFIQWMTQPERAARWSIDTGYVATSAQAYDTPALKAYAKDFPPALVARDQLAHGVAEFSTHENQRVTKALNDAVQAALTGGKTPAQALKDAQAEAERILRSYR